MGKEIKAVAFGEMLYDMIDGKAHLGGTSLNFAFYLRQFGIPVSIVSAVGKDELGKRALSAVKKAGIDTSYIQKNNKPTGYVSVKLDQGQPEFTIHKNVAWDEIKLPRLNAAPELFYFGTLSQRSIGNRKTLQALLKFNPKQLFFDVNLRQSFFSKEILFKGLKAATIVKFNDSEWLIIKKMFRLKTPADIISKFLPSVVILTKASKGAEVYTRSGKYTAKGPKVKVVDAVGAGDAFSGSFAAALLSGADIKMALTRACKVGAFVVTKSGAQNNLPAKMKEFKHCEDS